MKNIQKFEAFDNDGDTTKPQSLKEPKTTWTREEVAQLIEKYDRQFKLDTFAYTKAASFTVEDWINKNL